MWQKLRSNSLSCFFYAFLIFVPIGTRVLLYQFTNGFDEYEAIFLYASDILMLVFLMAYFLYFRQDCHSLIRANERMMIWTLLVFISAAGVSIFFATVTGLAIYNFTRLVLLVTMALAVSKVLKTSAIKLEGILAVVAASAAIQSLVGIGQFLKQESLGLAWLGEPLIGPNVGGAAKIIAEGGKVLRAYGTFPHPNVLGAFMILGLLSVLYFLLFRQFDKADLNYRLIPAGGGQVRLSASGGNRHTTVRDGLLVVGLFVIILGLILSFSRAAWLVGALAMATILAWAVVRQEYRRRAIEISAILLSIFVISIFSFHQLISPRAQVSASEPAVTQRLSYNQVALNILRNNFFGVGIGNQVLYSVKNEVYQKFGMDKVWQWQPIHNIYLLIAAEVGVGGLLAWLIFVFSLLISNYKFLIPKRISNSNTQLVISNSLLVIAKVMLASLLLLGLFDHYLWTLQPGRLMLWLIIGIVLAQRARSSTDRMHPSEG